MLIVHHLENSQSFRIVWLLEELNGQIPYHLQLYKRDASGLAPPLFKAISPLGTSPTITDNEESNSNNYKNGNNDKQQQQQQDFALSESNAIMDYILDKADQQGIKEAHTLRPTSPSHPSRTDFLFWYHASASSFMFVVTVDSIFRTILKKVGFVLAVLFGFVFGKARASLLDPRLTKLMECAERQLTHYDFLAGNVFTVADIAAIYPFDSVFTRYPEEFMQKYPHCQRWLKRMQRRPSFQKALERIGEDHVSLRY